MAVPVSPAALAKARDPVAIAEARKALGWTQEELAAVVGCSLNTVLSWEAGRRFADPVNQVRLARALRFDSNPQPVTAA